MKEIEELMKESAFFDDFSKLEKNIVKNLVKSYSENLIDYISENIDADYNLPDEPEFTKAHQIIEVYCLKGQFDEFKKMIK